MALWTAENPPVSPIGHARQCVGVARSGRRCARYALKGCEACGFHGGWSERYRQGHGYPAHLLRGRLVKREIRLGIEREGLQWLWEVEAFRRAPSAGRLRLFEAAIRARDGHDPGAFVRAREAEEERQKWTTVR
jgi:hypothetical protein